jgi:hypothetical protein
VRAIVRLIWTYFTGTLLARVCSTLGLAALTTGYVSMLIWPAWTLGVGQHPNLSLFVQATLTSLAFWGVLALFFASSLLPVVLDRIALGGSIRVLPWGRARLLASVACTAALIAVLTALAAVLAFYKYPVPVALDETFVRTFLVAFVNFGIMYVAVWLVSRARTGAGLLASSMLVLLSIGLPLRFVRSPNDSMAWPIGVGLAGWLVFAALLLAGPRLTRSLQSLRARTAAVAARWFLDESYSVGRETALVLGTGRPWVFALGQCVPLAVAALLAPLEWVWLFFLTLFSAISGAVTSYAATRSRSLWLRTSWTRPELFRRVEHAYLLHNAHSLGALLLLLAAFTLYFDTPARYLALGAPLLVLGTLTSSYLGLLMTRGLGLLESVFAITTMVLLMFTAFVIAWPDGVTVAVALEIVLAALALVYRSTAKSRWEGLDWMRCRSERLVSRRQSA